MDPQVTFRHVRVNGVRLHVAEVGPEDGPLVVLLHGFPEFWYGWRAQIPALAWAGYRVIAPDQRGYNLSEKPKQVSAYRAEELVNDVRALIEESGRDSASIVGHDLGAMVAWLLALWQPQIVEKLAILNVPHPLVFRRLLLTTPSQMLRSSYIPFFQLPYLPETVSWLTGWRLMRRVLLASSRSSAFSEADLDRYREAWARPGAFGAMLNWYRAFVRHPPHIPENPRVSVPAKIIWGVKDDFLIEEMAHESARLCDRAELTLVPRATHWLQHEEPDLVNARLLSLLDSRQAISGPPAREAS